MLQLQETLMDGSDMCQLHTQAWSVYSSTPYPLKGESEALKLAVQSSKSLQLFTLILHRDLDGVIHALTTKSSTGNSLVDDALSTFYVKLQAFSLL